MKTKYSITRYKSKVMIFIAQDESTNDPDFNVLKGETPITIIATGVVFYKD